MSYEWWEDWQGIRPADLSHQALITKYNHLLENWHDQSEVIAELMEENRQYRRMLGLLDNES